MIDRRSFYRNHVGHSRHLFPHFDVKTDTLYLNRGGYPSSVDKDKLKQVPLSQKIEHVAINHWFLGTKINGWKKLETPIFPNLKTLTVVFDDVGPGEEMMGEEIPKPRGAIELHTIQGVLKMA